jgi:hypothetical protein
MKKGKERLKPPINTNRNRGWKGTWEDPNLANWHEFSTTDEDMEPDFSTTDGHG